jgi:hypothetical protein
MSGYDSSWEFLDGPGLAEWMLEEAGGDREALFKQGGPIFERVYREWAAGRRPHYTTVDGYLVRVGLHLAFVPDHLWRAETTRGKSQQRRQVAA